MEPIEQSFNLTGEVLLWVSVIMQSVHDAKLDFNDTQIHYSPKKTGQINTTSPIVMATSYLKHD